MNNATAATEAERQEPWQVWQEWGDGWSTTRVVEVRPGQEWAGRACAEAARRTDGGFQVVSSHATEAEAREVERWHVNYPDFFRG